MYIDKIKQIDGFYTQVTFFFNFELFRSEIFLVLPCLRLVRTGNFDAAFINETFVIQLNVSIRQHTRTHPVYKYRLPFPYKVSKIFWLRQQLTHYLIWIQ